MLRFAAVTLFSLLMQAQQPPLRYTGRAMQLLASSTPMRHQQVRLLFYGQSITKQDWSRAVASDLRRRFPFADLVVENRAIGGYSAEFLIQTFEADVYSFYPDLIIFHDFGNEELYEKMITAIRRNTAAELLLQNDYPVWTHEDGVPDPPAKVAREQREDTHSWIWMPALCERLGCRVMDVRHPWYEYLKQNKKRASDVLADGVHLNAEGNRLLADITNQALVVPPSAPSELVREYSVGQNVKWEGSKLTLPFTGNRIELVAAPGPPFHAETADVRIDGRKPSSFPELYRITRPTDTYAVDWPALNRVTARKPLVAEDWTLTVKETNADDSVWRFEVVGSVTGPDGEGSSDNEFVSRSGRVVTEPGEWGFHRAFELRHQLTPVGFQVHWSVLPLHTDRYRAPRVADGSREYVTVLASGLANGPHTLELTFLEKTNPSIRVVRVYRSPL